MNQRWTFLVAVLLVLLPGSNGFTENSWEHLYSREGVDVYQKPIEGTEVRDFMGIAFIDAHPAIFSAVLADVDAYSDWIARCRWAEEIRRGNTDPRELYFVMSSPFPYRDRDLFMKIWSEESPETGVLKIFLGLSEKNDAPEINRRVRIPLMEGNYRFEYFGPEKTRMTYRYRVDPGGNVPLILANNIEIKNYPYVNISGMREMVSREKYLKTALDSSEYKRLEAVANSSPGLEEIIKSRAEPYFVDSTLLDLLYDESRPVSPPTNRQENHSKDRGLSSIQRALVDLFVTAVTSPAAGQRIQDLPLEEVFSVAGVFPQDLWLTEALIKEKRFIKPLLGNRNKIFEKLLQSETIVKKWAPDSKTADIIMSHPAAGKTIAADSTTREKIVNRLEEDSNAVSKIAEIIADRLSDDR